MIMFNLNEYRYVLCVTSDCVINNNNIKSIVNRVFVLSDLMDCVQRIISSDIIIETTLEKQKKNTSFQKALLT